MFRFFLPTVIRELRSLTKVILVIYVYDVNGMMAACLPFNITKKLVVQININFPYIFVFAASLFPTAGLLENTPRLFEIFAMLVSKNTAAKMCVSIAVETTVIAFIIADPGCCAFYGVGARPLNSWDCAFESR